MENLTAGELAAARKLVAAALAKGYAISVWEGGGWAIRRSTDEDAILKAMGSTEADKLFCVREQTRPLGWVYLVYGNAPDGSELIADCSDNEAMIALVRDAEKKA